MTDTSATPAAGAAARQGGLALTLVLAVSFGVLWACPPDALNTWVAFLAMTVIPTQIICGLVWRGEHPAPIAALNQPWKGLGYLLLCAGVGAVVALATFHLVGGGIAPPTPPLIMYVILSIVVTFWFVVVWGAWPISALPLPPTLSGLLSVGFCYVVAYGLFETLCDFSFLKGAPFYAPAIDPHGMFVAWKPVVFGVTSVAAIGLAVLSDFWPVTLLRKPGGPAFSALASVYVLTLAAAVFYVGTVVLKMDIVAYLVTAPIPFLFGFFIVLNLLQGAPFAGLAAPARRVASVAAAAAAGAAMRALYLHMAPILTGQAMTPGAPGYQLELWLANAMLAVTFPLIVLLADLLGFWPLQRPGSN